MTNRPSPPVSAWLCLVIAPIWVLSLRLTLLYLLGAEKKPGYDIVYFIEHFGAYSFLFWFGWALTSIATIERMLLSALAVPIGALSISLLLTGSVYDYGVVPVGPWQEVIVPTIFTLWSGTITCLALAWVGIHGFGLRARWAVPMSLGSVLLAFKAFSTLDPVLNGAICLYSLPILYLGLRESPDRAPAPP